ncbi:MAG TPA: hypothetical protein VI732_00465 [Alphaproteobacteria bacterium]|nr:hypothetical protein [Alphaproteobacteria bacterium]
MAVEDKRVTVRQALSQAAALHRAAKFGEAEALCRRILEAEPE